MLEDSFWAKGNMDSESLRARWLHAMKGTVYEKMHHA